MDEKEGLVPQRPRTPFSRNIVITLVVAVVVLVGVCIALATWASDMSGESSSDPPAPRLCTIPAVTATNGMVSTSRPDATTAGLEVLKEGGTAADAATAIQFMLSVTQPQSCGIGGGFYAVHMSGTDGAVTTLDAREEAPDAFSEDAFCMDPPNCSAAWPQRGAGGHPVGVPGTMAGLRRLRQDFGSSMSWSRLVEPAVKVAREGFVMYDHLHLQLTSNKDRLSAYPETVRVYYPDVDPESGEPMPVAVGKTWANPDLGDTLETLAKALDEGEDVFYHGEIAEEIITAVQQAVNPDTNLSGVMSLEDLAGYRAVYREPVQSTYHNYTVYGIGGSGSGGPSLAMMLNLAEQFSLTDLQGAELLHKIIDIQDIVWPDRNMYMADSDWVSVPLPGLLDKEYAAERAAEFMRPLQSARVAAGGAVPFGVPAGAPTQYAEAPNAPEEGTTHFTVTDGHNTISMTTTINANLGSGVVVLGRGFLLNNELTDFDALPRDPSGVPYANAPAGGKLPRRTALGDDAETLGGKRPRSSMAPTILVNRFTGLPYLGLGAPGGSAIIGTVFQSLIAILHQERQGECLADGLYRPRTNSQNFITAIESRWFEDHTIQPLLEARDFQFVPIDDSLLGYVFAVRFLEDQLEGAADARFASGLAQGY